MQQIVECVPNFSDGRRPEVYNAIADAIRGVPGAQVFDVSADPDHNRTVITFVGSPAAVEEGAFQAIAEAARLIDLDEHEGEHPRLGSTDVCPFIPVKGVSSDDCVEIARRLGHRVGEDLDIAVYLYGAAATRPERKSLAAIRRGEYELWRDEVATNPDRLPDYGPAEHRSWGATVIGVRPFLIAYNIYLNTDDVDVANKIARAVRFSSGGLRHVQALGFLVEGQAQVSMNLTDFSKTPVHRVQETVRREAARYGLAITKAELVGLIPETALLDSAKWYLQLNDLSDDQVLEIRMAEEQEADITPLPFLEATAEGKPTPGGGSVAALAGALGAALAQMVANLTVGRKKYAAVETESLHVLEQAGAIRQRLTAAIHEDSAAFDALMSAWRNKDLSGEDRLAAIKKATVHASEVPLEVARLGLEVARLSQTIASIGNSNALTDAAAGGLMARAAVRIAAMNVKVNALDLEDTQLTEAWLTELDYLETEVASLEQDILSTASERGGF